MFTIREYNEKDAETIVSWISDERMLRQWSADKYESFPITADDMNAFYAEIRENGGKPYSFYEDDKLIGHFVLRMLKDEKIDTLRIGFIIVDNSVRGKGYGSKMLSAAIPFGFKEYSAQRITLGVFENNPKARKCYESVGFTQWGETECLINGEPWKCAEMEIFRNT